MGKIVGTLVTALILGTVQTGAGLAGFSAFAGMPEAKSASRQTATILYFNDAHQIMPVVDSWGERGGMARLKTIADRVRRENPHTVVVFGGDLAGGTLFGGVYRGFPTVEALNRLPVDLANFGQHDFDFGLNVTRDLIRASKFQWFSSNLVGPDGRPFAGVPSVVVKQIGRIAVGFLGLTDAMNTTTQDAGVTQNDLVASAKRAVTELKTRGVRAVVAVTQAEPSVNEELLIEVPEISAVLSEEISENRSNVLYVGNRPILTPCGNLGSAVRLDLSFTPGSVEPTVRVYPVDSKVPADGRLERFEREFEADLDRRLSEPVAELKSPLDAGFETDGGARQRETNAGNLVADAFRAETGADIGLMNGGGIRADIRGKAMTIRDVFALLPFGNQVCMVELTGREVRAALEHGVAEVEKRGGRLLQVSGLRYEFESDKPPGRRVTSVSVGSSPLDPAKTYRVAMTSYLLSGGDGFHMFQNVRILAPPVADRRDTDVVIRHCRRLKSIDARVEGRITVIRKP